MPVRTFVLPQGLARAIWPAKSADETADCGLDWSARLAEGDAIEASTFELPHGLVSPKAGNTDKVATVWISGGEAGEGYDVRNRIKTRAGAALEQTIRLKVKSK
ncbi:phage fiber-tail adaptor protein [Bradyrhizobium barranii]|uniref:phage fiber-tail adaptor protein n=1 Tax=Bradyrhizobium TaxID=374 RepID=UPI003F1ED8BE